GLALLARLGETAAVLADARTDAADDLVQRAAGSERRRRLGEGHALLGHHAPRLALADLAALDQPHYAQSNHALCLGGQPRSIEGKFRPGLHHGRRDKGMGWRECKGVWFSPSRSTQPLTFPVLAEKRTR